MVYDAINSKHIRSITSVNRFVDMDSKRCECKKRVILPDKAHETVTACSTVKRD